MTDCIGHFLFALKTSSLNAILIRNIVKEPVFMSAKTYISNDFLDKYLASAPAAYMLVYICAQRFIQEGKADFAISDLAAPLGMTERDVKAALDYWDKNGVKLGKAQPVQPQRKIPSAAPSYSEEELGFYMSHNSDFRSLLNSAEVYMGKLLSVSEISALYSLHDWLRLPLEVIEMLLAYCCENGHRSMRYIEKVAITWVDEGVCDTKSALEHLKSYNHIYMRIMRALGIDGKAPVPKQKQYMKKWSEAMPLDLILYGCEKTALVVTNGNPFPYADKIFSNWQRDGIDTLDKAKAADEKFAADRDSRKSERAAKTAQTTQTTKTTRTEPKRFNYEQREWDFDELERIKREKLRRKLEE